MGVPFGQVEVARCGSHGAIPSVMSLPTPAHPKTMALDNCHLKLKQQLIQLSKRTVLRDCGPVGYKFAGSEAASTQ